MSDDATIKLKKQEQRKGSRLTWFGRFLILFTIAGTLWLLSTIATLPEPEPPPAIAEQGQGQGNVIINNNNTAVSPISPSYHSGIQVIHFTNIVPERIGRRYQHGTQIISPVPCGRTNVCAFEILPLAAGANYCIIYLYYSNEFTCVPVDPNQPYVEINATD